MHAHATASNAETRNTKTDRHDASRYRKVLDGRKQPIRGLWQRGDRFYARVKVNHLTLIQLCRGLQFQVRGWLRRPETATTALCVGGLP